MFRFLRPCLSREYPFSFDTVYIVKLSIWKVAWITFCYWFGRAGDGVMDFIRQWRQRKVCLFRMKQWHLHPLVIRTFFFRWCNHFSLRFPPITWSYIYTILLPKLQLPKKPWEHHSSERKKMLSNVFYQWMATFLSSLWNLNLPAWWSII